MLAVIDIGNTSTEIGIYNIQPDDFNLIKKFKITTLKNISLEELNVKFNFMFVKNEIDNEKIHGVSISSVVPEIEEIITEACELYFNCTPMIVTPDIKDELKILYDKPEEIGADRIVNAIAVKELYKTPAIVIDFGTATTFDVISEKNEYLGGVIMPGVLTSISSLSEKASKLSKFNVVKPERVIGKATVEGLQSGTFYSTKYSIKGIIHEIINETGFTDPYIIATGGLANFFEKDIEEIDLVDEELILKGLKIFYHMHSNC